MFRGTYEHTIDAKGRTSLPSRFREALSQGGDERLMLTKFGGCLHVFPMGAWERLETRIAQQPQFNEGVQAFQRTFIAGAMESPVDAQGRILIPPPLRSYAVLDKEIVFIGLLHRIEVWAADRWAKTMEEAERVATASPLLAELKL